MEPTERRQQRRMTRAVERLADDPAFRAAFRTDPQRAAARYHLTAGQLEAIKAGDPASLTAHGVDVRAFATGKRRSTWARTRRAVITVASALAGLGLTALPASAVRAFDGRIGLRRAGRRSPRMGIRLAETSSIRAGLGNAIRASGGRFGARRGARYGLRQSGRMTSLRRLGIAPCTFKGCDVVVDGAPFELAPEK